jgi:hypothetical protein
MTSNFKETKSLSEGCPYIEESVQINALAWKFISEYEITLNSLQMTINQSQHNSQYYVTVEEIFSGNEIKQLGAKMCRSIAIL